MDSRTDSSPSEWGLLSIPALQINSEIWLIVGHNGHRISSPGDELTNFRHQKLGSYSPLTYWKCGRAYCSAQVLRDLSFDQYFWFNLEFLRSEDPFIMKELHCYDVVHQCSQVLYFSNPASWKGREKAVLLVTNGQVSIGAHERQLKFKTPAKIFCYSRKFLGKTNQI